MQEDLVELTKIDLREGLLIARVHGADRAGVIADATTCLERHNLYVESITFNLVLPRHDAYEMGIVARGGPQGISKIASLIKRGEFIQSPGRHEAVRIHWPTAYLFHIALYTPDRNGLTGEILRIVDVNREVTPRAQKGSFVHMVGITVNSGGPEGGTAYFSLRANVATYSLTLQAQIIDDLMDWAKNCEIENDLWIRDLNP